MRPGQWSLARQLLALQVLLLSLVVGLGAVVVFVETRRDTQDHARDQVLALAESLAVSPYVLEQLRAADPARGLQPYAERVRRETGVDFVVFMSPDRTRFSHPNPAQLGRPFIGTIGPALAGQTFTETYAGTLGPSVRAVAPIFGPDGRVVALVSVGITTEAISRELGRQLSALLVLLLLVFVVAFAGAMLVSRRLRRQTHGLGAAEITRMYEYYDAVLHSVREGLVLVDRHGRVQLVNDEARHLLGLPALPTGPAPGLVGAEAAGLGLPPSLGDLLGSGRPAHDEIHLTGDRVLVVNQRPARWEGRILGTVATLRDHTELQELSGELDSARAFAESLRSQSHEAANRLHTMVSLIEMGRVDEAVEFATAELELAQQLTDRVVAAVEEPVLSALLLGKSAQASERGVELEITDDTFVRSLRWLPSGDIVTVVGNLVDNAIDAAADGAVPRRVSVTVRESGGELVVQVADTGCGLDQDQAREAFQRGWSTKPATAPHGRGLGLALVGQVVRRHGGTVKVGREVGAVFTVRLPEPASSSPAPASLAAESAEAAEAR
jgi:sensor histidine kinase regulating citrate/malate metabolism